jgi:hypothetical protein
VGVVLEELELGGAAEPWQRAGFALEADGSLRVGAVTLRFAGEGRGIRAWTLREAPDGDIDGLPTRAAPGEPPGAAAAVHPNGALRLDHVVVFTPELDRTFAALDAARVDLRRVRDAGTAEHPLRQGFYRLGEVILEVVGDIEPPGRARFWGLVVIVQDLEAAAAHLGEHVGRIKDAVQPGRRIATVRESAGLGLPVALMTP